MLFVNVRNTNKEHRVILKQDKQHRVQNNKMTRENWLRSSETPTFVGPRPDAKDPLETSKQGLTDLYKIGIPPLSSAVTPLT